MRAPWFLLFLLAGSLAAADLYISPNGNDRNRGDRSHPMRAVAAAQKAAHDLHNKTGAAITPWFLSGTYYLPEAIVITPEDSGLTFAAAPDETPVLSGGVTLSLKWQLYRDGIQAAAVPTGLETDQIFVNGERLHLARYPNYDPKAGYFDGWSPDAFSKARAAH